MRATMQCAPSLAADARKRSDARRRRTTERERVVDADADADTETDDEYIGDNVALFDLLIGLGEKTNPRLA